MPPNYSTPEGKPFGNVYFVKAPEKSDAKPPTSGDATATQTTSTAVTREKCVIMQAAQKPPYFYLQMQEDKLDVSPGKKICCFIFLYDNTGILFLQPLRPFR